MPNFLPKRLPGSCQVEKVSQRRPPRGCVRVVVPSRKSRCDSAIRRGTSHTRFDAIDDSTPRNTKNMATTGTTSARLLLSLPTTLLLCLDSSVRVTEPSAEHTHPRSPAAAGSQNHSAHQAFASSAFAACKSVSGYPSNPSPTGNWKKDRLTAGGRCSCHVSPRPAGNGKRSTRHLALETSPPWAE